MDASQREGKLSPSKNSAANKCRAGCRLEIGRIGYGSCRPHQSKRAGCSSRATKCELWLPFRRVTADKQEMLRSEIESVKSGSGQADRVKQLETQISELEAEASRLLRALDQVKESKAEGERAMKKKVDEAAKEAASHVSSSSLGE